MKLTFWKWVTFEKIVIRKSSRKQKKICLKKYNRHVLSVRNILYYILLFSYHFEQGWTEEYRQAKPGWIGKKWSDTWSFSESAFEVEFGVLSIDLWCKQKHYAWLVFYILWSCDISIIFKIINKKSHVLHCI